MAFVAFCFLVHDGRVKVFLDDERLELSEWLPSCSCCTVFLHLFVDQGQPNPKDNFLICRSKPVYTSSLGQPAECQLMDTFYSECGAIFLVLLVFFHWHWENSLCYVWMQDRQTKSQAGLYATMSFVLLTQFGFWNYSCHPSGFYYFENIVSVCTLARKTLNSHDWLCRKILSLIP